MLDTYIIRSGPSHVSVDVDVQEHRAPTDESVRLLKEMEEAALSKLVCAMRLENNELKATAHVFRDHLRSRNFLVIRFRLNGSEEREVRTEIERPRVQEEPGQILRGIRDAIAHELATVFVEGALRDQAPELERLLTR